MKDCDIINGHTANVKTLFTVAHTAPGVLVPFLLVQAWYKIWSSLLADEYIQAACFKKQVDLKVLCLFKKFSLKNWQEAFEPCTMMIRLLGALSAKEFNIAKLHYKPKDKNTISSWLALINK